MADLLDRIRSELRERLAVSRAAVEEHDRLQGALDALQGSGSAAGSAGPERGRRRASAANPSRRGAARSGEVGSRASRGANREAVLRVVRERPGVSAAELASASGVGQATLYGLLRRLIERGEAEKEELPGGRTGYVLGDGEAGATARAPLAEATARPESRAPGQGVGG